MQVAVVPGSEVRLQGQHLEHLSSEQPLEDFQVHIMNELIVLLQHVLLSDQESEVVPM